LETRTKMAVLVNQSGWMMLNALGVKEMPGSADIERGGFMTAIIRRTSRYHVCRIQQGLTQVQYKLHSCFSCAMFNSNFRIWNWSCVEVKLATYLDNFF